MVRLTSELIARGTSGYIKRRRDEGVGHFMKRVTHLYLEDKNIDEVGDDLAACRNLSVLYLYDNKLLKVPNLISNSNLTHLYLQNNAITKIQHLDGLNRLTKLYLGGNSITVLEGVEQLECLQELHLENQTLPKGEKMLFDPRSLMSLSKSLEVLDVSGNSLDSVRELEVLQQLAHLVASDNDLNDMKEMVQLLSQWRDLRRLDLIGNPLCHKNKYRDRLIVASPNLELLDGKEITDLTRVFLKNLQANRDAVKRRRESASHPLDFEGGDLPPVTSSVRQISSVPGYIMPGLPRKQFQDVLAKSASQPIAGDAQESKMEKRRFNEYLPTRDKGVPISVPIFHDSSSQKLAHNSNQDFPTRKWTKTRLDKTRPKAVVSSI